MKLFAFHLHHNPDPWNGSSARELENREVLREILARLDSIAPRRPKAVKIALELPRITRKGIVMPNYELPSDEVATISIKTTDVDGDVVAASATDVFSVVSSSPSLGAVIGKDAAGNPAVVLTPMVKASPNITVTVSDSAGLVQAVQIVDIVTDTRPTNVVLDLADAVQVSQLVPTAPGP